jgi:hypothetical protein
MSGFDSATVHALFNSVVSVAEQTGFFRSSNTHEPKGSPGSGLRLAIWMQDIEPIPEASGLASATALVVFNARIYGNMLEKPEDEIDPRITTAAVGLIGAFSTGFTLGGTVRNVDLLGAHGPKLRAQAGYVTIAGAMYRVMTVTVGVILDDVWTEMA